MVGGWKNTIFSIPEVGLCVGCRVAEVEGVGTV